MPPKCLQPETTTKTRPAVLAVGLAPEADVVGAGLMAADPTRAATAAEAAAALRLLRFDWMFVNRTIAGRPPWAFVARARAARPGLRWALVAPDGLDPADEIAARSLGASAVIGPDEIGLWPELVGFTGGTAGRANRAPVGRVDLRLPPNRPNPKPQTSYLASCERNRS